MAGGGDALLQFAHLGGQGGLVPHRGGHTAQQGRHFRTGHGKTEDVINEEQHIPTLVTKILGHGKSGQGDAQAHTGRLIHLTKDHDGILHHARLQHFTVELGSFAAALAHPGKNRVALVHRGDRADEFLDDDGLADTGAAEDAGLPPLGEGGDQIDDLDASLEDLGAGGLVGEERGRSMDGIIQVRHHGTFFIDRQAQNIKNTAQGLGAHRHHDGSTGGTDGETAP